MHVRCTGCGTAVGGCPFESDGLHERLVATLGAQLPRAEEWQVRELAEIVERGGHARHVLPLSQALAQVGLGGALSDRCSVELGGVHPVDQLLAVEDTGGGAGEPLGDGAVLGRVQGSRVRADLSSGMP